MDDGVNCFKALTRDSRAVAAGGGLEVSVARALRDYGTRQAGLQQYSICAFADALEAIPRTLAENSGLDAQVHTSHVLASLWSQSGNSCGTLSMFAAHPLELIVRFSVYELSLWFSYT